MSNYSEILKHPKWQKKRLEIMKRDEFKCQLCDCDEVELHVHHISYEANKKPWEYENDNFITLCKICHTLIEHSALKYSEFYNIRDYHIYKLQVPSTTWVSYFICNKTHFLYAETHADELKSMSNIFVRKSLLTFLK